ncbi:MAG: AbrB/MazE/SpoVT family DNA-binding domain-containing protein [Deltaproteobacteria bacterium]
MSMQSFFKGKAYGAVTVGERGQLVIPAELRKELSIKPGDQLMVFCKLDKKVISMMPSKDFSEFLEQAAEVIAKLEKNLKKEE